MSEPTVIANAPPATPIAALRRRIEAASPRALVAATVLPTGIGLIAAILAGPVGIALFAPVAAAIVAAGIAALRYRNRVASLPLEISPVALVARRGSSRTYRFRARLGHGRAVAEPRVEVLVVAPDGRRIPLSTARLPRVIGPFTVLATDAGEPVGDLLVRVSGREGPRRWEIERTFGRADLRPGRFTAGVVRRRGRLEVDPTTWDAVVPEDAT